MPRKGILKWIVLSPIISVFVPARIPLCSSLRDLFKMPDASGGIGVGNERSMGNGA